MGGFVDEVAEGGRARGRGVKEEMGENWHVKECGWGGGRGRGVEGGCGGGWQGGEVRKGGEVGRRASKCEDVYT